VALILDGTFNIPGISLDLKDTLTALHTCCMDMDQPFPRFTTESYCNIWSRAKEKTSLCAQYDLHFGHYMAVCADQQLTELHVQLIDITLMMGYSPTQWQMGVNVMILKKEGNYNVELLRTILLYDAEFNGLLKWLGQQFMIRAEQMDALAPEQYGSRAGLAAIFQSLNMQIFWMWFAKENSRRRYVPTMPKPVMTGLYMALRL